MTREAAVCWLTRVSFTQSVYPTTRKPLDTSDAGGYN